MVFELQNVDAKSGIWSLKTDGLLINSNNSWDELKMVP